MPLAEEYVNTLVGEGTKLRPSFSQHFGLAFI